MVTFQDVADFYLKYKGDPTTAAWEKFGDAHEGWFTEGLHDSTEDAAEFNAWVIKNPYFVDCLEAWVEGKGVIMTRTGQAYIVLEGTPLCLNNFKGLATLSNQSEWKVGDLLQVGFTEIDGEDSRKNLSSLKPIQELPKDFKEVGGSWFDTDDDWNYRPWSKFINEIIVGTAGTKSNLPIFLEFSLSNFDSLLNWKTTESLRNLFGL